MVPLLLFPPFVSSSAAQTQVGINTHKEQSVRLEQGKPIERELTGADVHAYSIQLTAGEFLRVIVDQRGIDVVVMTYGPNGERIAWVDGTNARHGPEPVILVADATGSHRLEVRSVEVMSAGGRYELNVTGRYEVKIETLRATSTEDKKLIETFEMENRASELAYIGYVQQDMGNNAEALDAYQKSLPWSEAAGNKKQLALTLSLMGQTSFLEGNYSASLDYYKKSLTLAEELGSKGPIAARLNDLSLVYRNTGNFSQALNSGQLALAMHESLGNKRGAAHAEMSLGLIHSSMGDYARALEHYRKSLALGEELGVKRLIANALDKIGHTYNVQGNHSLALEYAQKSLKLNEEIRAYRNVIFSLLTVGNIHQSLGKYGPALEHFQHALLLSEKRADKREVADALIGISSAHIGQRNYVVGLEAAQRAAAVARQIGNHELLLSALNNSAHAYFSLNDLENSRRDSEEAIGIVETLRASVSGDEARASYFASAREPYERNVHVLMQLHKRRPADGYALAALQSSERARARSLLETLSEARANIRQGVDPALLEKARTLQQLLNAAAERQTILLSGKHTPEQATRIKNQVAALTDDYRQIEVKIRLSSPRYAALTQPAPLSVREIQSGVLDAETALLEYALGDNGSYLWVVTANSVNSFELPKREVIERDTRRVVELLSDGKRWAAIAQIDNEYVTAVDHLSRMLLPPQMMSQLNVKRLVIVGDGALQYLPFGALSSTRSTVPRSQPSNARRNTSQAQPLIADYEIVSLPSASTLAVLRRETANRARPTKSVVVLADPVFEITDERVQLGTRNGESSHGQPAATTREASVEESISSRLLLRAFEFNSTADDGGAAPARLRIARLPFTGFEAENILVSAPKGQNLKATGFRASRETATSPDLAQYRIVHFATHGILNSEHPELSGIVLSLVDEQGQPVNGFLRAHEIYNLNLPADLVVLSACQTALGKEIRGEGLIGLTRGFMYAGAPRVVASLWKVDDSATAELMKRFYEKMLKNKLPAAAALRAAKVEMWKQKRWESPFYWAAFELQGEWK